MTAPQKRETPLAGGEFAKQSTDGAAPIIGADEFTRKRIANAKAELALRGFTAHDASCGGWLVARWNLSHYCARVADLEAFLKRVGGQP